jgi:hypothetical protein
MAKTLAAQHAGLLKAFTPPRGPFPPKTAGNLGPPRVAEHVNLSPKKVSQKTLNAKSAKAPKG